MNHSGHLKQMAIGAAVVLGALLLVGVPVGSALPVALALACPLMMVAMMVAMPRGGGHQHAAGCHGGHEGHDAEAAAGRSDDGASADQPQPSAETR